MRSFSETHTYIASTSSPDFNPTLTQTSTSESAWANSNPNCTFDIPSPSSSREVYHYDLCPLLSSGIERKIQVVADENTPPTHTRHVYDIARLGEDGLEWDGTLPSSLQCSKGTWMCLTVINTRPDHPSEPSRILQVIPISTIEDIIPKAKYVSDTQLQVAFHGGRYTGKKNKAIFQFHCDTNVKLSSPEFLWNFNGTHTFSWASKHACPTIVPVSTIPATPTPPSIPDNEPPDSPPSDNEDPEPPNHGAPHNPNSTLLMFVSVFLAIFLALYLRRRIPGRFILYPSISRFLRAPRSYHQIYSSDVGTPGDQLSSASISLEDIAVEGHDERELLSPKDTTFPKYGL